MQITRLPTYVLVINIVKGLKEDFSIPCIPKTVRLL